MDLIWHFFVNYIAVLAAGSLVLAVGITAWVRRR